MTKLEKLAQAAKDAQRVYDTAVNEARSENEAECDICKLCKEDEIVTRTTAKGFEFACKATPDMLVKSAVAHLTSAFDALKEGDADLETMMLAIKVKDVIQEQLSDD